ncbi:MAG: DUF4198 domain-containing protein [Gemmatales bacterium]|nr:DUF4198 domain-containing protein [Gemmatales bacterium]MDW7995856.1 DUF4198 domain-containing protein [Gemmatales bacterium]
MRNWMKLVLAMVALVAVLAVSQTTVGHELKVFASQMILDQPGRTVVYLSWGHALPTDELVAGESLASYESIAPDGKRTALPVRDLSFQEAELACEQSGIYQVVAARKSGVFTYVYDATGRRVMRRGGKKEVTEGKIDYAIRSHQFAKAVVVVGQPTQAPPPCGQALEIVPLDPPSQWKAGQPLPVQVLLHGKPLAGEILTATYVGYRPQGAWCFARETDREGTVKVPVHQPGTWVMRVRHRRPTPESERSSVDYETYTATLTLEVRP